MKKIIVIGAGVSGLTVSYWLQKKGLDVEVFEAQNRAGGVIETLQEDGYLFEKGPNSFLDNEPATMTLTRELGIENELLRQSMRSNSRYIFMKNKLHDVPMGPGELIKTKLLSGKSKRGLLLEGLRKSNRSKDDESLASFIRRRLGDELLQNMVTPFVSGVYAGDPEKLSLRSTFAMLYDLERNHGSLTRGALTKMFKKKKDTSEKKKPRAKHLCSFIDGMQTLTQAMADSLGDRLHLNAPIQNVTKTDSGFTIHLDGDQVNADAVVVASPSYVVSKILHNVIPDSSAYLETIPYNALSVVGMGYSKDQIAFDCNGFGFLAPRNQGVRILGSIWSSSLFPRRAPGGQHCFTVFIGGGLDPEAAALPDDELLAQIKTDLNTSVGCTGEPAIVKIFRWEKAIPQYPIGHHDKLELLQQELTSSPGLFCLGNYLEGISSNDCISNATEMADTVEKAVSESSS
jgi:oxygen-dependent protoporphyrinogen oxidase